MYAVPNVSSDQVCFNACELQPGKEVPWLATGVWRSGDSLVPPPPVEPANIVPDKVVVYRKVADTCSVLVGNILKPAGGALSLAASDETEKKVS